MARAPRPCPHRGDRSPDPPRRHRWASKSHTDWYLGHVVAPVQPLDSGSHEGAIVHPQVADGRAKSLRERPDYRVVPGLAVRFNFLVESPWSRRLNHRAHERPGSSYECCRPVGVQHFLERLEDPRVALASSFKTMEGPIERPPRTPSRHEGERPTCLRQSSICGEVLSIFSIASCPPRCSPVQALIRMPPSLSHGTQKEL